MLELDCNHLATYFLHNIVFDVPPQARVPTSLKVKLNWSKKRDLEKIHLSSKKTSQKRTSWGMLKVRPQEFVSGRKKNIWFASCASRYLGAPSFKQEPCIFIILGHCSRTEISQTMERQNALTPKNPCCVQAHLWWAIISSSNNPNSIGNTCIANVYKHLHIYVYIFTYVYNCLTLPNQACSNSCLVRCVYIGSQTLYDCFLSREVLSLRQTPLPSVYTLNSQLFFCTIHLTLENAKMHHLPQILSNTETLTHT